MQSTDLITHEYHINKQLDIIYPKDQSNPDIMLLVFHGGYYVGGGRHNQEPYCRLIASKGYFVANIDYSLAPENPYPTQLLEGIKAINYLKNQYPYVQKFVLSGDSAGAHLASQLTALITNPKLQQEISVNVEIDKNLIGGFIGNCGFYEASTVADTGFFMIKDSLKMLMNNNDYKNDSRIQQLDITKYVDYFPPSLLICGDEDLFLSQNILMYNALHDAGIEVRTYFPTSTTKKLSHEFQCNYDLSESYIANNHIIEFLKSILI